MHAPRAVLSWPLWNTRLAIDLSWLRSMNIAGVPTRTIRFDRDRPDIAQVIDQRPLPHHLVWQDLTDAETTA